MSTIKFLTLGCKVNQYETQSIREQFIGYGFKELNNHKPADVYIVNTCTVTHRADRDSFNFIRRIKKENPNSKIVVTGCLTEFGQAEINKIDKNIIIIKNKDKNIILEILKIKNLKPITHNSQLITFFKNHTRAFLKIQDGCNNFCSYCIVPFVRGKPTFRDLKEIKKEANILVNKGVKEIVLTGICLGSHPQLVEIIAELEKIPNLLRIRLSSIEANDVNDKLIKKIKTSKKLCRHLHIPMQSGDDRILELMNRKYTTQDYLKLVKKIRRNIPKIAITTDIIVGFPTEDEISFKNTINFLKKIKPSRMHIFSFSPRQNTPAYNLEPKVNPRIVKERYSILKKLSDKLSYDYHKKFLNKKLDVLIEGKTKEKNGFWEGYSDNYIRVFVKSNKNLQNHLIWLKIKKIGQNYVTGNFS